MLEYGRKYMVKLLPAEAKDTSNTFEYDSILVRDIPQVGKSYKIIVTKPLQQVLVIFSSSKG